MDIVHGFVASGTFTDDKNFPYGFSKSGHFSIPEASRLEAVGNRLNLLEQGIEAPANQVEENFVAVCKGEREAQTKVEMLWLKYLKHTKRRTLQTLGISVSKEEASDVPSEVL